jgi:hypothetical protein
LACCLAKAIIRLCPCEGMSYPTERFREVQRMRSWWFLILTFLLAGLAWWGMVQQLILGEPWGNNPASDEAMLAIFVIMGIGLPLFLLNIRMTTVVSDSLQIRFFPFSFRPRTIPPEEIVSHSVVRYRPLADYGGYGIRGLPSDRAYNVSGDRGVKLILRNGNAIMIGSQRAEELNMALDIMLRSASLSGGR